MTRKVSSVLFVFGVALLTGACASSQEWSEWYHHTSHFASGQHAFFSLRNGDDSRARVTRADVDRSSSENWWGRQIAVNADQIIER
jgi:hypothetical protein